MNQGAMEFGREAEQRAAEYLSRRGYRIMERNYRTRRGEIDVIAYDGNTLVFVEVKARRGEGFGDPHWSVNGRKKRRLWNLARYYLYQHRLSDQACRFDMVLIRAGNRGQPLIELLKNAFEDRGESL